MNTTFVFLMDWWTSPTGNRISWKAFELVFRPWMRRRIHAVRLAGLPAASVAGPLVLVANHVSWWDGFALREVHHALRPEAPMYTLMGRRELERHSFLRLLGAVPVEDGCAGTVRSALRRIEAAARERPDATLLVFPQGRIWPSTVRPLRFARGAEVFARRLNASVLPIGLHLEPLNTVAPTIFVSVGRPLTGARTRDLARAVTEELDRILAFLGAHGEEAAAAWPSDPFLPIAERAEAAAIGRPTARPGEGQTADARLGAR